MQDNFTKKKFRAWDSNKNLFPLTGFHILGECTVFDLVKQYSIENFCDLIITQTSGVLDKDGNDVYEGDIVFWEGRQMEGEVVFEDCQFLVKDLAGGFEERLGVHTPIKVIGNVFENPELKGQYANKD